MCETWMAPWASRLQPKTFSILGGEPTLNRELERIVRSAATLWPQSIIRLVSNGFLLNKHPGLAPLMAQLRGRAYIEVSSHHSSEEFQRRFRTVWELAKEWRAQGVNFQITAADERWTRRYKSSANRIDFLDGDPRAAWKACAGKYCRQIYLGKLWKCPPVAYFGVWPSRIQVDKVWRDLAASYVPLDTDCTDDELATFLAREEEEVCRLCPSRLERFDLPNPLKSRAGLAASARRPEALRSSP
jgi:hypothetical protein